MPLKVRNHLMTKYHRNAVLNAIHRWVQERQYTKLTLLLWVCFPY